MNKDILAIRVKDRYEKEKNSDIRKLISSKLTNNELYTEKCVKFIIGFISRHNFVTSDTEILLQKFRKETCVTLEEKKKYGIKTRQKINKRFFDLLSEKGKHQDYILKDLRNMFYSSKHFIFNKYEIIECKSLGIREVKISCCNDDRNCPYIEKYRNKKYPIDEAPELPLPECTADFCRCMYLPVIVF